MEIYRISTKRLCVKKILTVIATNCHRVKDGQWHELSWHFSVTIDAAKNHGVFYIDFHVWVCVKFEFQNVHLPAVPLNEFWAEAFLSDIVQRLLIKVWDLDGKDCLINIAPDGVRNVTEILQGDVSHFEGAWLPGFFKSYCVSYQGDFFIWYFLTNCLKK